MATLPLKSCGNEHRAVIRFFCGKKDLMQMRFTLRCVQCMATSVLRDQQYTFGVRSLLLAEKALLCRSPDGSVQSRVGCGNRCRSVLDRYRGENQCRNVDRAQCGK